MRRATPRICLLLTCDGDRTLEIRFRFHCVRRVRHQRDFPSNAIDLGFALIGEDGVRDVTIAPRNDAAAVAIGSKSWPLDIRLRPWVFRPLIGSLRYFAGGDVRPVATNGWKVGAFRGFVGF